MIQKLIDRIRLVDKLDTFNLPVGEQFKRFAKETGMSRPTFMRYRRLLGLKKLERTMLEYKFGKMKGSCYFCHKTAELTHHIDEDRTNNALLNLLDLCASCHMKLHNVLKYHKIKPAVSNVSHSEGG